MTDAILIQPDTPTIRVHRYPNPDQDAVSITYTDMQTGLEHVWAIPLDVAGPLSLALASIVDSPTVNAHAEQLRNERRD